MQPGYIFFTEAPAEFQHVNCMIVRIWEGKRVAHYARAEFFTKAVASVASMVATPPEGPLFVRKEPTSSLRPCRDLCRMAH